MKLRKRRKAKDVFADKGRNTCYFDFCLETKMKAPLNLSHYGNNSLNIKFVYEHRYCAVYPQDDILSSHFTLNDFSHFLECLCAIILLWHSV